MKGLKIAVALLSIITVGLVVYVVYKEVLPKESKTTNIDEYQNKINILEKENKQLKEEKEEASLQCESTTELPKFEGTYSFGDPNQIDVCGDTLDKIFYYKVSFHNDGTAELSGRLNCGSGFGVTGKYYVNEDEIVIIDKDCDGTYMCSEYEIIHYEGDKLSVHNSYMGKQYTLELIKE